MRKNRPIETPIKGRRLLIREPIDASSWAYMKMLRENDDTRRFYAIDPYAEVYKVRDNVYAILTISADGMGEFRLKCSLICPTRLSSPSASMNSSISMGYMVFISTFPTGNENRALFTATPSRLPATMI